MSVGAGDFIELAAAIADPDAKVSSKAKPYLINAAIVATIGGMAYASYRFGQKVAERREQAAIGVSR